jgi:hypothetical protein
LYRLFVLCRINRFEARAPPYRKYSLR